MYDWRRFVFDTSTAISAALNAKGKPRAALAAAGRRGELIASDATFAELESRLHLKKFDRYLDAGERTEFLGWMQAVLVSSV